MTTKKPPTDTFTFDSPEEARGFIAGIREGARFMGDDDPLHRLVDAELAPPPEPWSHGATGKWIVTVHRKDAPPIS